MMKRKTCNEVTSVAFTLAGPTCQHTNTQLWMPSNRCVYVCTEREMGRGEGLGNDVYYTYLES